MSHISALAYTLGHLARLRNSTKKKPPSEMTRYSGGSQRTNQPYITGYHQVLFFLPELLFTLNTFNSQKWLRTTCETFTPHSSTMNMADVPGIGGVNISFPITRVTNREFTLGFREYQNLPILNTIKTWHSICDPNIGTSPYTVAIKHPFFTPHNYKATIIVANVKPTHNVETGKITNDDLEDAYIYTGCFPVNSPVDMVNASDQSSNESIAATVTFKFDGAPYDLNMLGVETLVTALLNESYYETIEEINRLL